ncbi:MAG: hypothetical protein ACI9CP_001823, partial [Cryomorphaceae bacterium]
GPQRKDFRWDEEEDPDDLLTKIALGEIEPPKEVQQPRRIVYVYQKNDENDKNQPQNEKSS